MTRTWMIDVGAFHKRHKRVQERMNLLLAVKKAKEKHED